MRDFYRAYESDLTVMTEAMTIGWTQNVVILEADLTIQERIWYIQATGQFGWSKLELQRKIAANAHQSFSTLRMMYAILRKNPAVRSVQQMMSLLCICHSNICRSSMVEVVRKDLVRKAELEKQFHIESAATSIEEIGNPVCPPTRRK